MAVSICTFQKNNFLESANRAFKFSNRALVKAVFEALKCLFKHSVVEAPKLVSTKNPLLKHFYRRQGIHLLQFSAFCV